MIFDTVLIEDEQPAMDRLERLLEPHRDLIRVIGHARDGLEALTCIERLKPALLFLDIQMPELDGFQVLARIEDQPMVIFTTAYDQFALKAFENNTIDYLLKPIDAGRLERTVTKLRQFDGTARDRFQQRLRRMLEDVRPNLPLRIQVRQGKRIRFLDPAEICFFRALDKYVAVHTHNESYLISDSLTVLESRLPSGDFVRIHRSALVNWHHLGEMISQGTGAYQVRIKDKAGTILPVSRKGKINLEEG